LTDLLLLYTLYTFIQLVYVCTPKHKTINQISFHSRVFASQFVELQITLQDGTHWSDCWIIVLHCCVTKQNPFTDSHSFERHVTGL